MRAGGPCGILFNVWQTVEGMRFSAILPDTAQNGSSHNLIATLSLNYDFQHVCAECVSESRYADVIMGIGLIAFVFEYTP